MSTLQERITEIWEPVFSSSLFLSVPFFCCLIIAFVFFSFVRYFHKKSFGYKSILLLMNILILTAFVFKLDDWRNIFIFLFALFILCKIIIYKKKSTRVWYICSLVLVILLFVFPKMNFMFDRSGGLPDSFFFWKYSSLVYSSIVSKCHLYSVKGILYRYWLFYNPILRITSYSYIFLKAVYVLQGCFIGKIKKLSLLSFLNYFLFFSCYTAGPIDRYERFEKNLDELEPLTPVVIYDAIYRIVCGMFKKCVLVSLFIHFSFLQFEPQMILKLSLYQILITIYSYSLVLYFDFSGYTDLAIGTARLFGITLPENFDSPYLKSNITLFWRAWHMSFTRWMMDFIFVPLSIKYRRRFSTAFLGYSAIFVTFLFCGFWHGEGAGYLSWGIYHGMGLIFHKWYSGIIKDRISARTRNFLVSSLIVRIVGILITFNFVSFGWIFFSNNAKLIEAVLTKLF